MTHHHWTTSAEDGEKTTGRFDSDSRRQPGRSSRGGFGGYVKTLHVSSQEAASDVPSLSARRCCWPQFIQIPNFSHRAACQTPKKDSALPGSLMKPRLRTAEVVTVHRLAAQTLHCDDGVKTAQITLENFSSGTVSLTMLNPRK